MIGVVGPNRGKLSRVILFKDTYQLYVNLEELIKLAKRNRRPGWTIQECQYIEDHIYEWRTIIKSTSFPIPGYLDPMVVDVAIYVVRNQYCDCKDIERKFSVGYYRAKIYIEVLDKMLIVKRNLHFKNEVLVKDLYVLNRIFNYYLVSMPSKNCLPNGCNDDSCHLKLEL